MNKNRSPAEEWDRDSTRRSLDELFTLTHQYKSSQSFIELLEFVGRFRSYSPYNGMLAHTQKPGARYVATATKWFEQYTRRIITGSRPILLLRPMGPVMFVFDVSDTEPLEGAPPLPPEIVDPFKVRCGFVQGELDMTIKNAKRDGIRIIEQDAGSQFAGSIRAVKNGDTMLYTVRKGSGLQDFIVPIKYEMLLNFKHTKETKYTTLIHELAHLYCGHLGTPHPRWWPDRRGLSSNIEEFEAESVSYLVCARLGIDNPSDKYLAGYREKNDETPTISLDCIMKAGFLIEQMGYKAMKPRKDLLQ